MSSLKPLTLFDNQKDNVRQLLRRRRALLSDKVGAGKTLSVLYAFSYLYDRDKMKNLLVATPLSAYEKRVWARDIDKFTYFNSIDLDTLIKRVEDRYDRLSKLLDQYQVIYCKHSHVRKYQQLLINIAARETTLFCIDEIHAFKNRQAEQTVLMQVVANQSRALWGITGTSLSKNLEDVYNIVSFIRPWYFGAFSQFRDDFCVTREKVIGRRGGRVLKALEIVGLRNEEVFRKKLEPIMIAGDSFIDVKYHYVDYTLSEEETALYQKIANGVDIRDDLSAEEWVQYILSTPDAVEEHKIKDVDRYSSRFIYLQACSDGILSERGTQDKNHSTKIDLTLKYVDDIIKRGQSAIVYFDFKVALQLFKSRLEGRTDCVVEISTGDHVLGPGIVTEAKCKQKPRIILCTRAASESESYYFINNVIFFHIPTVPSVFVQTLGRITRKNTLYPDDLNCYILRSNDIQLYKLLVVSAKAYQMEQAQLGHEERNIPPEYKQAMSRADAIDKAKKLLLWNFKG